MKILNIIVLIILFTNGCSVPEHDLIIEIQNNSDDTLFFENFFSSEDNFDTASYFTFNYFEGRESGWLLFPDSSEIRAYINEETPIHKSYNVIFFDKNVIDTMEWKIENFDFVFKKHIQMTYDSLEQKDFKIYYQ
jgi:hypothetical protein